MHRVFLYGDVAAGKSTICASLACHAHGRPGWVPRIDLSRPEGARVLNLWKNRLREGRFPPQTRKDAQMMVNFSLESQDVRFGLTLYEASGEQVVTVNPLAEGDKDLVMLKWMDQSDVFIAVLPANSLTAETCDPIAAFMDLLAAHNPWHRPLGLVLSKWDRRPDGCESLDDLCRSSLPLQDILKRLNAHPAPNSAFPFSVGNVQKDDMDGDTPQELEFDPSRGTASLFTWIVAQRFERREQ